MTAATKNHMANWTKMVVATGGTGNPALGAVNGYPPIADTLGTNKSFHYVFRAVNNTPLEAGVGVMIDAITLRRDNVYAKMVNGVYTSGEGLEPLNLPAGCFLYTAPTKEMLQDLVLEMPMKKYVVSGGALTSYTEPLLIDCRHKHIEIQTAQTNGPEFVIFDPDTLPPVGVKHEITLSVYHPSEPPTIGETDIVYRRTTTLSLRPEGNTTIYHFGNGIPFPELIVPYNGIFENLNTGLINGSVLNFAGAIKELNVIYDANNTVLQEGVNYSFDVDANTLTIINIGSMVQPFKISYIGRLVNKYLLTTTDGGATWVVESVNRHQFFYDVGTIDNPQISGAHEGGIDIRYPNTIGSLDVDSGVFTINGVSNGILPTNVFNGDGTTPAGLNDFLEPAHFSILNRLQAGKTLAFDISIFSIINSQINTIYIPPNHFADFTVQRNPHAQISDPAYKLWLNGIAFNVTATGNSTTWNINDYAGNPPLTISNNFKTIEATTQTLSTSGFSYRGAKAFGGKNAGKWYFSIRCDGVMTRSGVNQAAVGIGIASASQLINSLVGANVGTASIWFNFVGSGATGTATHDEGTTVARTPAFLPQLGDIITVMCDLTLGHVWYLLNLTPLFGGNPNAGTNPTAILAPSGFVFPKISISEGSGMSAGVWTLLDANESGFIGANFPTWLNKNWTG